MISSIIQFIHCTLVLNVTNLCIYRNYLDITCWAFIPFFFWSNRVNHAIITIILELIKSLWGKVVFPNLANTFYIALLGFIKTLVISWFEIMISYAYYQWNIRVIFFYKVCQKFNSFDNFFSRHLSNIMINTITCPNYEIWFNFSDEIRLEPFHLRFTSCIWNVTSCYLTEFSCTLTLFCFSTPSLTAQFPSTV